MPAEKSIMEKPKARILIVDDDEDIRTLLKKTLRLRGYSDILEATDGKQALEISREKNPDLIVLDTVLPDIDGREVCRRIKGTEGDNPKVVICTSLDAAVDSEKASSAGADAFVPKTFDFNYLLDVVAKLIHPQASEDTGTGKDIDKIRM